MRRVDRHLRLFVQMIAPLLALSLAGGSFAASGAGDLATASPGSGVKLAQQGKAPAAKAAPAPAPAAPAPAAEEPAAWAVSCTDQGLKQFTCEMTQSLIDQKSNTQVVLISIKSGGAPGESKAMLIRFFHGVYLPTGVSVKVDGGQASPIAFQKSDRLGVYAALPLTDRVLADMKRGKDLRLSVEVNKGQPLEVVARLIGFAPAFDRLSSIR